MNMHTSGKTLVFGLMALGWVAATVAPRVNASTFTYTGGGVAGMWGDSFNWEDEDNLPGIPGAGDTAIMPTNDISFNNFDGHSAGVIEGLAGFSGSGTFTMDNNGSLAEIRNTATSANFTGGAVLAFTDDLWIDSSGEITTSATFQGAGTLTMDIGSFGWKMSSGTNVDVGRLDVSGAIRLTADDYMPDFGGVVIDLGSSTWFRSDWGQDLADGLEDSHIEMDTSFNFFSPGPGDTNYVLQSWLVGNTQIPNGTYDENSASIGDADFGTILNDTDVSITVIPEPSTILILLSGVACLRLLRRHPRRT